MQDGGGGRHAYAMAKSDSEQPRVTVSLTGSPVPTLASALPTADEAPQTPTPHRGTQFNRHINCTAATHALGRVEVELPEQTELPLSSHAQRAFLNDSGSEPSIRQSGPDTLAAELRHDYPVDVIADDGRLDAVGVEPK